MTKRKSNKKQAGLDVKTFPVPFSLGEVKNSMTFSTSTATKPSKEQIIKQAIDFHLQGNICEATKLYKYCIEQGFISDSVCSNYAMILKDQGQLKEAEMLTIEAIKINPNIANHHFLLSNILRDLCKLTEAELSIRKAIEVNPNFAEAYSNLGSILIDLGNLQEAELTTRKAIEVNPNFAEAYSNLGSILIDLDNLQEAESMTRKAIKLNSKFAIAYSNLGFILRKLGKYKEANEYYSIGSEKEPNNIYLLINSKLHFSHIMVSNKQIDIERKSYKENLKIISKYKDLDFKGDADLNTSMFYLAYQNRSDDKLILEELANTISNIDRTLNRSFDLERRIEDSKHRKKIRLGICCNFLYTHSVSYWHENIIKDIAKSGIEVILFKKIGTREDSISKSIEAEVSKTIILPKSIIEAQKVILGESLDILFYPEVGMSNHTYLLSLSRLALVQVVGQGHPNTSGSPNIDYFISCKFTESNNSEKFYSERLIRFNRLPVRYSIPQITKNTFQRKNLNLTKKDFLIGLPHTVFKYHPDFDYVLAEILKEIPNAVLFLFSDEKSFKTKQLKSRWESISKLILQRTIIHPIVEFDMFLAILKQLDIVLDPFYFGMGNTFYQSMAFGIPVVTMPSDQARGKIVSAGYKQMDIKTPPQANSPSEYISICKKLAFNNSYKKNIINQISSKAKGSLFNDKNIYREYLEFFEKSLNAARNKNKLPIKWSPKEY